MAWVRAVGRYQLPSARLLRCYQNVLVLPKHGKIVNRKGNGKRPPGRPATGRDPVLTIRLPLALRSTIETWAKQQKDRPSRSEAIRRLIEFALAAKSKNRSGK